MVVSQEDIELAEEVRKYLALYDSHVRTITKTMSLKIAGWERVKLILGIESGDVANKNFMLLRKRYNKAREKQRRSKECGTSRHEMLKKCGDVKGNEFLSWLTPFIVSRQTKSNLSIVEDDTANSNDSFENTPGPSHANNTKNFFESGEDDDEDDSPVLGENENVVVGKRPNFCPTIPPILPQIEVSPANKKTKVAPGKSRIPKNNRSKKQSSSELQQQDAAESVFVQNADKLLQAVSEDLNRKQNDAESFFASYIADSLRHLHQHLKFACQHELSQVLFKYQTSKLVEQTTEPRHFGQSLQ